MRKIVLLACLLYVSLSAAFAQSAEVIQKRLLGIWRLVSIERDGKMVTQQTLANSNYTLEYQEGGKLIHHTKEGQDRLLSYSIAGDTIKTVEDHRESVVERINKKQLVVFILDTQTRATFARVKPGTANKEEK